MDHNNRKTGFWAEVMQSVTKGYLHFIPAIIIVWVMVEVVAVQLPRVPWVAQFAFFMIGLDYYHAAAVRASQVAYDNPVDQALLRGAIGVIPMMIIALLGLFTAASFLPLLYLDNLFIAVPVVVAAIFVDLYMIARLWPFWCVPFFFEGEFKWSPAIHAGLWSGPQTLRAWQLTRDHGLLNIHTRRFMSGLLILVTLFYLLRFYFELDMLANIILYMIGLPLLSLVGALGTREMLKPGELEQTE